MNRKLRIIAFSGMAIALGTVASNIKVLSMPMGGSATLFSMLFVTLIGYWYGAAYGIPCAVAYGLLQLVIKPSVYSIPQAIVDYVLAFGALGLSGFFSKMKGGLYWGYIVSVFTRFIFSALSGYLFFAEYTPEEFSSPIVYSAAYNGSYLGAEMILTLVVIGLPPVRKALIYVKKLATAGMDEG